MEPCLLVFDLDGTLIDSRADLTEAVNHMRATYDLAPLDIETVSSYVGDGVVKLVERALEGAEVDLAEAVETSKAYYLSHLTVHTYLYEGVAEGLRRLAGAGHKLALLTNKPGDPSREILRHFQLAPLFCAIVGGGDAPALKPDAAGFELCLDAAGMTNRQAWMIGDHCTDLAVAENAGAKSAYVRYGYGEERGYKPDAYFASFPELVGYFV